MNDIENDLKLVKYDEEGFDLDIIISYELNDLWLTQKDISILFNTSISRVSRAVKNTLLNTEIAKNIVLLCRFCKKVIYWKNLIIGHQFIII